MATAVATTEPARGRWRLRLPDQLPNLKGKWLTAYTVLWAITLPPAIYCAAMGTYIGVTTPTMWSPYGFSTTEDSHGLHVDAVQAPAVRAAGISPGDYVVAVDGWRLPASAPRAAARAHVIKPEGSFTSFTLRRPSGELYSRRLVRSLQIEEQAVRAAGLNRTLLRTVGVAFTASIPALLIFSAILLFTKRRRETVPALLSLSFLLFASTTSNADLIGVSAWLIGLASVLAVVLAFQVFFAFPSGRFEPRWTVIPFLFAPVFLLTFLIFPDAQTAGSVLGVSFFVLAFASFAIRYRRLGPGAERQQLRWAFFGLAVCAVCQVAGLLLGLAVNAWQAGDPRWSTWSYFAGYLGAVSFYGMVGGLLVSMLRYRLYDADAVIGRSAAYGMLTLGFVALFAGSQKVIELIGQEYLGQNIGGLAGGIGAALAAVAIAPMHARAQRWAERSFQKSLYRLRHGLPPLVGDLRETAGLEQIAGATLDSLVGGVRTRRAALIAGEDLIDAREVSPSEVNGWLQDWRPPSRGGIDCVQSDQLFPVRVPLEAEGHGRVGWLLLGSRPDNSLFSRAEFEAMEEIAEPVARAMQVALRRSELEQRSRRDFEALERRIKEIEKRLAQLRPRQQTK